MDLSMLGWSSFSEKYEGDIKSVARVLAVHRSHLLARTEDKEINLYLSGYIDEPPCVGDWVTITPEFEDEQGRPAAIVRSILERKSEMARWMGNNKQVMAANVDQAFIVTSANQDLNINRLHRFLLLIKRGGISPIIILSKIDLIENADEQIKTVSAKLKVPVIGTSMITNLGIENVLELMPLGSTSLFVGSSGVGKSSLVNRLLGSDVQLVQEIRSDDDKGRHTTTGRELFFIPNGGMVIDSPGVREVQVFGGLDEMGEVFPEIEAYVNSCRFNNCRHESEPGCAIQEALQSGDLDAKEWENFLKLRREMEFVQRKTNKVASSNAKKRWRNINMAMRKRKKLKEEQ
ncbi:MAG: ribosome small subunit-dependent GTPase A [Bdellovibrionales bacterium]